MSLFKNIQKRSVPKCHFFIQERSVPKCTFLEKEREEVYGAEDKTRKMEKKSKNISNI